MGTIRLEARYIGHEVEAALFSYESVSFQEAEYSTTKGADGGVMRSQIRPAYLRVKGLPTEFNPRAGWTHVECEAAFTGWSPTQIAEEPNGVMRFTLG